MTSAIDILPTLAGLCQLQLTPAQKKSLEVPDPSPMLKGEEMQSLNHRLHFVQFSQEDNPPEKTVRLTCKSTGGWCTETNFRI